MKTVSASKAERGSWESTIRAHCAAEVAFSFNVWLCTRVVSTGCGQVDVMEEEQLLDEAVWVKGVRAPLSKQEKHEPRAALTAACFKGAPGG